jgi:cell fate regulator YaaT (PSP1 superfamily)
MDRVVGIRFREGGKTYHFDAAGLTLKKGYFVIVNTDQGAGLGEVINGPQPRDSNIHPTELKKVERVATAEEIERGRHNMKLERDAKQFCLDRIKDHGLAMNLVDVEYFFDGSKIIFFFTADGRVDFRELVKDLVRQFKTRVELRQIGVRNQARMVGGLGCCGRELCCASFLRDFHPVSVKMAKEQNLSLNPTKISGACGRLMCCLKYEYDTYRELRKDMPKIGKKIESREGRGKVVRQNVLERTITLQLESGKEVEIAMGPPEENQKSRT